MALAKDQTSSCSFFGNMMEVGSPYQFPHVTSPYVFDDYNEKHDTNGLDSPRSNNMMSNHVKSHSPPLSSSSSANSSSGGFVVNPYQPHDEAHSLFNFKTTYGSFMQSGGSLLSFQQEEQSNHDTYPIWEGSSSSSMKNNANLRLLSEANCLRTMSGGYQDEANEWLFAEATITDPPEESDTPQTCLKRSHTDMEENMQALKKPCTGSASKKPAKSSKSSISKDPQSIAAKNRRERISERLKTLQDLVPNGTKVDLVTMLEKAIGYVKFLQLQVKVLATDEFWPAAGGKAPDISQVREAIDAILSTQRSTTSSSSE